jgi:hypothetical protein
LALNLPGSTMFGAISAHRNAIVVLTPRSSRHRRKSEISAFHGRVMGIRINHGLKATPGCKTLLLRVHSFKNKTLSSWFFVIFRLT